MSEAITQQYIDELQEAVSRRYAERTTDSLPLKRVPDFRPQPGLALETFGWVAAKDELDADPYKAAEGIVESILDLEQTLIERNPTATHRVQLSMGNAGPRIFRRRPDDSHAIKIRHDIGVCVAEGEPDLPQGPSYVGDHGEYRPLSDAAAG